MHGSDIATPTSPQAPAKSWRDAVNAAGLSPVGQNATKRAAIERMLRAHPEWSNRRIAAAIKIIIITEDDLDAPLYGGAP